MNNGSWEKIYAEQGRVQFEVLDSVVDASTLFLNNGYQYILDLGCGAGRHTYYLADKGFRVHACDISQTGLDMTMELLSSAGLNRVEYSIQDMYHLEFRDNTFDGILCIWVQGHGYREEMIHGINELHRVLSPGGMVVTDFVTTDDETYGLGEEISPNTFVGGRPGEEDIVHYYTTKKELRTLFSRFNEVRLTDKIYAFTDESGKQHQINAVIVEARK
ncbi:MAG: class I SAM-dependent methyltransferase [Anaerofustis sp.]